MATATTRASQFGKGSWVLPAHGGPSDAFAILAEGGTLTVRRHGTQHDVGDDCVMILSAEAAVTLSIPAGARATVLSVPGVPTDEATGSGVVVSIARERVSGILAHVIRGLAEDQMRGIGAPSRRVCEQLAAMVRAICVDEVRSTSFDLSTIYASATECIERQLWDIHIDSATIARELAVSTRTLHRAFRAAGTTLGSWIRDQRLERCRDDLLDPALRHIPVSEIGARWGLADAAHFSRLYKSKFGASPRAYRAQATSMPSLVRADSSTQEHVA